MAGLVYAFKNMISVLRSTLNKFFSTARLMPFHSLHYHLVFTRQSVDPEASHNRMIGDKMGCLFRQQLPALFQLRESVFHSCRTGAAHRSKQLAALSAGGTSPNIMLDNTLDTPKPSGEPQLLRRAAADTFLLLTRWRSVSAEVAAQSAEICLLPLLFFFSPLFVRHVLFIPLWWINQIKPLLRRIGGSCGFSAGLGPAAC